MTVRFGNYRLGFYIAVFLLSGTVLGLSAHFAQIFLPKLHKDFTIFSLIVPSLTIFIFLLTLQWGQPRTEAAAYFILWVLWLTMGAWSTDIIGNVQCDGLAGQRTATKNGDMNAQEYCYEMRVIQAFSWMQFCLFTFAIIILLALVSQAEKFGRHYIWREPIRELGWFGEWPGYYNHQPGGMYPGGYAAPGGYATYGGGYPTMMQGNQGTTTVIQPGINGAPPTITQHPMGSVV